MRPSSSIPLLVVAVALLAGCGGGNQAGAVREGSLQAPERLDFGAVPLGLSAARTLVLRNTGGRELQVQALELPWRFDAGVEFPVSLAAGATVEVPVSFTPTATGPVAAVARLRSGDIVREVELAAVGDASPLACTPALVDLGRPLAGESRPFRIECGNDSDEAIEAQVVYHGPSSISSVPATVSVAARGTTSLDLVYLSPDTVPLSALLRFEVGEVMLDEVLVRARPVARAVVLPGEFASALDFGFTPPGTVVTRTFVLSNASDREVGVTSAAVEGPFAFAPAAPFTIPVDAPDTAADESEVEVTVTFAPVLAGAGAGRLDLAFDDPTTPTATTALSGFGGGPVLSCAPAALDFGPVAVGTERTVTVTCVNAGTDVPGTDADRLTFAWARADPAAFVVDGALPEGGLASGEPVALRVTFRPAAAGPAAGSLEVASNDAATPRLAVPLAAEALALAPCVARIDPPALDFGPVAAGGTPATLPVTIHNDGTDRCLVRDLDLAPATASSFSLPNGPVDTATIEPGEALSVPVRFAPAGAAGTGGLAFGISAPDAPIVSVPLSGSTAPAVPCLQAFPESVDFGEVGPGCASLVAEVSVFNTCPDPVAVQGLAVAGGAASFHVAGATTPTTLQPGGLPLTVTVEYRPSAPGEHFAGLRFQSAEGDGRLVPIRGRATAPSGVEVFPPLPPQVDVLFVMDNSGGIGGKQVAAMAALPSLLAVAGNLGVDWRFGVTTTGLSNPCGNPGGAGGAEDGRLFPVDGSRPRVVRSSMADAATLAAANLLVGECHYDEKGMEAAYRALTPPVIDHADDPRHPERNDGNLGFLRADARLAVIELTDEADQSPNLVSFYVAEMAGAKREAWREPRFSGHAITGDRGTGCSRSGTGAAEQGDKLIAWSEVTGGHFMSICSEDWTADFVDLGFAVFGRTRLLLKGRPQLSIASSPADLRVVVDGLPWEGTWRWDAAANAVVFNPNQAPEPGSTVEVVYTPVCVPPAP